MKNGGASLREKLKVVDICSGVGGASIGVREAGHEVVAAIDNDLVACSTYASNLGLVPIWGVTFAR